MVEKRKRFQKKALSPQEHLDLLRDRSLIIPEDDENELKILKLIGYYRLSGYFKGFHIANDRFDGQTTFQDVVDTYHFDKKLRTLIFDAIEPIEVTLRTQISDCLSLKGGPWWFENGVFFQSNDLHKKADVTIREVLEEGKKTLPLKHYYRNYDSPPTPPSWMIIEAISFGKLHRYVYRSLKKEYRNKISSEFGYPEKPFNSFIHSLVYLRNLCAHHERLWNRKFLFSPKTPLSMPEKEILKGIRKDTFYSFAYIIHQLHDAIHIEKSLWVSNLYNLFQEFPRLDLGKLGFSDHWKPDIWMR